MTELGPEWSGRFTKAWAIQRACLAHGIDVERACQLDEDRWAAIASIAGFARPPSPITQAVIITLLALEGPCHQ